MSKVAKDRRQLSRHSVLHFERCEPRQMLHAGAGNVSVVENGHLFIRGDEGNNQIEVATNELGKIEVTGLNGTTINGGSDPIVVEGSYSLNGFRGRQAGFDGGLRAHMGRGVDSITVNGIEFGEFSSISSVDEVHLHANTFWDNFYASTSDADNEVMISNSRFYGDLHVVTRGGADQLTVFNSRTRANAFLVTGKGADQVSVNNMRLDGEQHLVLTEAGNDQIQIHDNRVNEHGLRIHTGHGHDDVFAQMAEDDDIFGDINLHGQQGHDTLNLFADEAMQDWARVSGFERDGSVVFDGGVDGAENVEGFLSTLAHENSNFSERYATPVVFDSTETITSIAWSGAYERDAFQNFNPDRGDSFIVEIYEGAGDGAPDTSTGVRFEVGGANRTESGERSEELVEGAHVRFPIYSYFAEIDFTMLAGQEYWVSIYTVLDDVEFAEGNRWGWGYAIDPGVNETVMRQTADPSDSAQNPDTDWRRGPVNDRSPDLQPTIDLDVRLWS